MTEFREQLLEMLRAVATSLGDELRSRLVFVGGCTTALLISEPDRIDQRQVFVEPLVFQCS
ncbi:hypothetical protein ACC759_39165, partial [Rhizobium ruizarguesonis]